MSLPQVNKNVLDVAQIYQTFITFSGDVAKTAAALNIDRRIVEQLAASENWAAKVAEWEVIKQGTTNDVQQQINRAVNYVQAHRLRSVVDSILSELLKENGEQLLDRLTVTTQHGSELKVRAITDLVKAAEACQAMSQRALGDTAAERPESTGDGKGSAVALQVIAAMNAAQEVGLDSVGVVKKQLKAGTPPKPLRPSEG